MLSGMHFTEFTTRHGSVKTSEMFKFLLVPNFLKFLLDVRKKIYFVEEPNHMMSYKLIKVSVS